MFINPVAAISCLWPCSPKHFLNPPTVWGLRWCNFRNIDPRCSKNQILYPLHFWTMAMFNRPWGKKIGQEMEKIEQDRRSISVLFSFLTQLEAETSSQNMSVTVCMWVCWRLSSHCFSGLIWQGYMSSWAPGSRRRKKGFRVPFDLRPQSITHYQCQFVAFLSEDTAAPRLRKRSGRGKDTTTRLNTNKDNEPWDKTNEI